MTRLAAQQRPAGFRLDGFEGHSSWIPAHDVLDAGRFPNADLRLAVRWRYRDSDVLLSAVGYGVQPSSGVPGDPHNLARIERNRGTRAPTLLGAFQDVDPSLAVRDTSDRNDDHANRVLTTQQRRGFLDRKRAEDVQVYLEVVDIDSRATSTGRQMGSGPLTET